MPKETRRIDILQCRVLDDKIGDAKMPALADARAARVSRRSFVVDPELGADAARIEGKIATTKGYPCKIFP